MQNLFQRITFLLLIIVLGGARAWAVEEIRNGKTYNVVYLKSGGSGNGDSKDSPVGTWAAAYKKLSKTGGTYEDDWNKNIIVVDGSMELKIADGNTNGGVPATITGVWPWENEQGESTISGTGIQNGGKLTIGTSARSFRLGSDTRFKNICFTKAGRFCLFLHNTCFDTGCIMNDMGTLDTNMGAMDKTTHKAPDFHLFLYSDEQDLSGGAWNQTTPMKLTIKSGRFGRILCTRIGGTNWDTQVKLRYVVGTPDKPLMAKIEVDIDESNDGLGYNPTGYKDDIAFLCAGTTQGTVFVDMKMDIKRGKIATLVAGSQGNAIAACDNNGIPSSSYFGRTVVDVDGNKDSDVTIFRYFGACLGRLSNSSSTCSAYFYGHSTLNLIHGTIEQNVFASAGGLSGLVNPNNSSQYTTDTHIPYMRGSKAEYPFLGIDYNKYDAGKTIVKVKSRLNGEEETIDLADTEIITNISGGIVKGNVYGGSYGYSSELPTVSAPKSAGSLWGNTQINISGGTIGVKESNGDIKGGNVYGGGGGDTKYYEDAAVGSKANFLTVATVYGNTNVNITGKPTILGGIYGGGAGVASTGAVDSDAEFLDIAKVYGNTNIKIDADEDWEYTGNIYGGGSYGAVEGNTNVKILGGIINGNVFGAGKGEEGHPNKAKVTGDTNVTVGKEEGL